MSLVASIRRMIPAALKQPLRNYIDDRAWRRQPRLAFTGTNLRSRSLVDLAAIMGDVAVGAAFAEDHAKIADVYGTGEIFGGVNPGDRRALYHLIAHFKPKRVLEIGTHVGASTVYIASALRRFVEGGKLTTADISDVNGPQGAWKSLGMSAPPVWFVSNLGFEDVTTFITRAAAQILNGPGRYDLIFLDGDHSVPAVYREISAALNILNPQGLIVLHDFYPGGKPLTPDGGAIKGPSRAADRITGETRDIEFLPLGNLPWQTKAGGNATSLALATKRG
jgi:predicted O-methyltransferase YrrM